MNSFDASLISFFNGFAHASKPFDNFIAEVVENELVKGAVLVSMLWYFWFRKSSQSNVIRGRIIIGLTASLFAVIISRILTLLLHFRPRPFTNPELNFVRPYYMQPEGLETWNSFPSDHAILFFGISTCIFFVSKKAGVFAYLYTLLVICFPRVYFGYHYPTDILGGAAIGITITAVASIKKISNPLVEGVLKFSEKYTGLFYGLFFLLTYQIANGFINSICLAHYVLHFFR